MSTQLFTPPPYNGWLNVVSKTSTYAITNADDVIKVDGSSAFTVTLPTAVGIAGKRFWIKRTDQTLANAVTVATTSSQTIDGVTTTTLNTQYESIEVVSDGSNWQVLERSIPGPMTSYTPAGNGSNWTTNCTYTGFWRRIGAYIEGFATIAISGVPGSASTDPYITLPSGLTIDYSKMTFTVGSSTVLAFVGSGITFYATGSNGFDLQTYVVTGTNGINVGGLQTFSTHTGTVFPTDSGPRTASPGTYASGGSIAINFRIPISGWNG